MRVKADLSEAIRTIAAFVGAIGMIMLFVTFPSLAGDPGPDGKKTLPGWVDVMDKLALGAIGFAMLCGFVLWLHSKLKRRFNAP